MRVIQGILIKATQDTQQKALNTGGLGALTVKECYNKNMDSLETGERHELTNVR